ncbi:MAG: GspH/FimT family pseudopilin [Rubripirellula sp.]
MAFRLTIHSRRAFSLIELTIVMLMIGLIAAITMPRFNAQIRVVRLEAAARQLATHIDLIRTTAVNEARTTTLACAPNQYSSPDVDFAERIGTPISVQVQQTYDSSIALIADFNSLAQLTFDFEGIPHAGGSPLTSAGMISVTSGNEQFVVSIAVGTGRVSVSQTNLAGEPVVGVSEESP